MTRRQLNENELNEAVAGLDGWEVREGRLFKEFNFSSFAKAMGWMVSVAIAADAMDHHPEWTNIYNRVRVTLATHDLGDVISTWDVELAGKMNELA